MRKILIVDDEPMMLKIADRALKDHYETILASSGSEAVELFTNNSPDMVISDLKMPEMSGYELKEIIESKTAGKVPFIFLTSDDTKESEEKGRELGVSDYIKKPVKADVLLSRVCQILDNSGGSGGIEQNKGTDLNNEANNEFLNSELEKIPSWIKDEPLIQENEGINNCGSAEAYLSSVEIFERHIQNNIRILENCFESGDIENYTIKAHGLKSTSRIIGAMTLSKKAAEMEKAGNDKDIDYIKREHASFIEECKRHADIFLHHENDDEKEPITDEEFEDAMMAIREFAIAEEYGILESIVDSLMKRALKPKALDKMQKIKKHLIELDFDGIRKLADEN